MVINEVSDKMAMSGVAGIKLGRQSGVHVKTKQNVYAGKRKGISLNRPGRCIGFFDSGRSPG